MKKAGTALLIIGILIILGFYIWSSWAAMERLETSPMDGQLDIAIIGCPGCSLGLVLLLTGGGMVAAALRAERRE